MTSVGIQAIFTPGGKTTRTGRVNELVSSPFPSSPWPPRPHAHSVPSVSSAYSAAFELPTSATVPGRVTVTGRSSVSALAFESSKKEPQCRTIAGGAVTAANAGEERRATGAGCAGCAGCEAAAGRAAGPAAHPARTIAVTIAAASPAPPARARPGAGRALIPIFMIGIIAYSSRAVAFSAYHLHNARVPGFAMG